MKVGGSRIKSFAPSASRETFKDLLIFEERLKQNAERLQSQRRKYELFLFSMFALVIYLAYNVFIAPSIYSLVHYGRVVSFLVSLVTVILFFATGLYSEKIVYAYKFVPQANRALRPFNIYLNTRTRSRISKLTSFLRLSSPPLLPPPVPTPSIIPGRPRSSSDTASISSDSSTKLGKSPPTSPVSRAPSLPIPSIRPQPRGVPLAPIPPPINPRGDLIFSSRVSPGFREGYERYRGDWERRRNTNTQIRWLSWFTWFRRSNSNVKDKNGKEKDGAEDGASSGNLRGRNSRSGSISIASRGLSPTRRSRHSPNSSISSRISTPSNDMINEAPSPSPLGLSQSMLGDHSPVTEIVPTESNAADG